MKITIKKRFDDSFGEPLRELAIILNKFSEIGIDSEVEIDFSGCQWICPLFVLPLSCLIDHRKSLGQQIVFTKHNHTYLDTIYFPDGFGPHVFADWEERLLEFEGKTFLPITKYPTTLSTKQAELRENFLSAINSLLKKQIGLAGSLRDAVYYLIDEAVQNTVDHSKVNEAWIFAQYYKNKGYLDICIADSGNTIRGSYLDFGRDIPASDAEAIQWAVNGKSTKNQAVSRGFGISTSREMLVKGLKGKYLLWSGNSFLYSSPDREEIIEIPNFKWDGTLVILRIPKFVTAEFTIYDYLE